MMRSRSESPDGRIKNTSLHDSYHLIVIRVSRRIESMKRWEAAIATENPRILYRAVQLLNELGVDYIICSPTDSRCGYSHVIIADSEAGFEDHEGRILVQDDFDVDFVRIAVMVKLRAIQNPAKAVIGIDPGMTSGIALVIDGVAVYQNSLATPKDVTEQSHRLTAYIEMLFPQCRNLVRVGTGSKLYSALLLRAILRKDQNLTIELVNEKNTTVSSGAKSDESSAILIAGRNGRPMTSADMVLEAKVGYIRSLKQFVSRLTREKRVLTSDEARAILLDEIALDDMIP
jgi:hypothetical protein